MEENIIKLIKPADIITLINALLGFVSILMLAQGRYDEALILILGAVMADGADGAIARYRGYGALGANLDSLADTISFGVAPASAAFIFLRDLGYLAILLSGFFLICGVLRLARFNITTNNQGFTGVPITASGFIVALFLLIKDFPYSEQVFSLILVLLSLLMVSTVHYPKPSNPVFLTPLVFLLVLDIVAFFIYVNVVKMISSTLLVLIAFYILYPVVRKLYENQ